MFRKEEIMSKTGTQQQLHNMLFVSDFNSHTITLHSPDIPHHLTILGNLEKQVFRVYILIKN